MRGEAEAQGHTASRRQSLGPDPRWSGANAGPTGPPWETRSFRQAQNVPGISRVSPDSKGHRGQKRENSGRLPEGAAFDLGFRSDPVFSLCWPLPQPGQEAPNAPTSWKLNFICPALQNGPETEGKRRRPACAGPLGGLSGLPSSALSLQISPWIVT